MVLLDLNQLAAPGFTPLIITGVMFVLLTLLVLNMRKQFTKIDVPINKDKPESSRFAAPGEE